VATPAPDRPAGEAPVLEVRGVRKSFLGVEVLHGVDLDVRPGEVHALVGENGAGKSTLMKVVAGVHRPDDGEVLLDGAPVAFEHPVQAQQAGITTVFQEFNLLPERTVAENVFLGREPRRRGLVDRARMEADTRALLADLGVADVSPRTRVGSLSVAQQQVVEIVKALSQDARLISMDEPTAALAAHEVALLYRIVGQLRERGVGVLYVSHRLQEIFDLADRITVLKDGALVRTAPAAEFTPDTLVSAMVGRALSGFFPPPGTHGPGAERLRVTGGGTTQLDGIDLTVRAGEIVALAGLQGSGRTELAHALFGIDPFTRGEVRIDGEPVRLRNPARPSGPASRWSRRTARARAWRCASRCWPTAGWCSTPSSPAAGRAGWRASPTCSPSWSSPPAAWARRCATCPAATSRRSSWPSGW
jgi:ABC-type sugar transport system, ATPase component